jgi:DNA (cytosine-5)-methyltransferase 1
MGLQAAGFEVLAGAEWDPDACETFAKAHPAAEVLDGDVGTMCFSRWRGEVTVLVGGPPCQPWSSGGKRLGRADPRDGWPAFLRALDEVGPQAFLAENVAGLAAGARRPLLAELVRELDGRGYEVASRVVNAADYGVPQKRQRLIMVGLRDRAFEFPAPTHGPGRARRWAEVGTVVGPRPVGEPNPAIVTYARVPDLRPSPYDGHVYNGGGRPMDLRQPAPTLLASMGGNKTPWVDTLGVVPDYHGHLTSGGEPRTGRVPGARRITVDEAALVQSFPPGAHFVGRRSSCYRQIGNAVPPRLAQVMGEAIRAQLQCPTG